MLWQVIDANLYSLVEINAFLSELSRAVGGVLIGFVLHHLHSLSSLALLVAVLADHVQLANPVLETQTQNSEDL